MNNKLILIGVIVFLFPVFVSAETMYITDKIEVALRDGKGMEYKILAVARSNEKVEVLNTEGEYANIRLPSGVEGWLLSRYLTQVLPKTALITNLSSEMEQFKEKNKSALDEINKLKEEKAALENTRQMQEKKIKSLEDEYAELKTGCSDFVKLRDDSDKMKTEMKSNRETVSALTLENAELKENTRLMWFIFGASAVFGGFILGMYLQSLRNKRRRQISF